MNHQISAGGIVYRKEQVSGRESVSWLLCRHALHGGWVFPKGLVGDTDREETKETAALREVREEGGVDARIIAPLLTPIVYTYEWEGAPTRKTVHYFLMEYIAGDPKDHDQEMSEAGFYLTKKIPDILTFENDRGVFRQALRMYSEGS